METCRLYTEPCPCGAGVIHIDCSYHDGDWGISDFSWMAIITCPQCKPKYDFIDFGRGVQMVRASDLRQSRALLDKARAIQKRVFKLPAVENLLRNLALDLDGMPSAAARYRRVVELGLENCALATFRKHTKHRSMRSWLETVLHESDPGDYGIERLTKLTLALNGDFSTVEAELKKADELLKDPIHDLEMIKSFGPVNLGAALVRGMPIRDDPPVREEDEI